MLNKILDIKKDTNIVSKINDHKSLAQTIIEHYGFKFITTHISDEPILVSNDINQDIIDLDYSVLQWINETGLSFSPKLMDETIRTVEKNLYTTKEEIITSHNNIYFRNGTYNIKRKQFFPLQVQTNHPRLLKVDYIDDQEVIARNADKIKRLILPQVDTNDYETSYNQIVEMYGISLIPITKHKTFTFLQGNGDNGKTFVSKVMGLFFKNKTAITNNLTNLSENRFAMSDLHYANLLTLGEFGSKTPERELNILKSMTGGDPLLGEHKGKNTFKFFFEGNVVIASNNIPQFKENDGSVAIGRRFHFIHFPNNTQYSLKDLLTFDEIKEDRELLSVLASLGLRQAMKSFDEKGNFNKDGKWTQTKGSLDGIEKTKEKNDWFYSLIKEDGWLDSGKEYHYFDYCDLLNREGIAKTFKDISRKEFNTKMKDLGFISVAMKTTRNPYVNQETQVADIHTFKYKGGNNV